MCRKDAPKTRPISCIGVNQVLSIKNATYGRWGENAKKLCLIFPYLFPVRPCMDDVTSKLQQLCNKKKECYPNELRTQLLSGGKCWGLDSAVARHYFTVQYECINGGNFCFFFSALFCILLLITNFCFSFGEYFVYWYLLYYARICVCTFNS